VASPGDLPWVCRGEAGPLWIAPKVHHACNACIEVQPRAKSEGVRASREAGPRGAARQTGISEEHDRLMGRRGDVHSIAPTKEQTAAATEKRVNTIETFKARAVALLAEAAELGLERTIAGVEDDKDLSKIIGVWTRAIMMVGSPIPRCGDHRR
jgi:hypothetical protein